MLRILSVTQFSPRCDQSTVSEKQKTIYKCISDSSRLVKRKVNFLKKTPSQLFPKISFRTSEYFVRFDSHCVASRFCRDLRFLPLFAISLYPLIFLISFFPSSLSPPCQHATRLLQSLQSASSGEPRSRPRTRAAITRISI